MTTINYEYRGAYDYEKFKAEFTKSFQKDGRYNAAAIPDMMVLLGMIERDATITDIRWTAYMLATAYWETASPTRVEKPLFREGKPVIDKKTGKQATSVSRPWLMQMRPVDEVGKGHNREYFETVKVKKLADGRVRVTEQDGDQFIMSYSGTRQKVVSSVMTSGSPHIKYKNQWNQQKNDGGGFMGTKPGGATHATFDADDGMAIAYFGRGYVQLTWWENYASAGYRLGRGFDFVFDPELVKQPQIAYQIMSEGMRLGVGFANGKKFSDYFSGQNRDYFNARRMVNIVDHAADIAKVAEKFEAVLFAAKKP
jgi:hypothetical protein